MLFKKKTTNDSLLAAIDSGCVDNVLKGGDLMSDQGVISEAAKRRYGRGFAVVAEEVGRLAVTSTKTSDEITTTLNHMSDTINSMVEKTVGINENIASQVTYCTWFHTIPESTMSQEPMILSSYQ